MRIDRRCRSAGQRVVELLLGMKVGPTERIGLSLPSAGGDGSAGGAEAAVAGSGWPFLPALVVPLGCCACILCSCIFLALSSVTMMSPCCSSWALSSTDFSASDQVCPAALQEQAGSCEARNLNAVGSAV